MARNGHQLHARAAKLWKLVLVLDRQALAAHLSLTDDALLIANRLETASAEYWTALAQEAKCNPPSADSVRALVAFMRDRANPLPAHVQQMTPREFGRWESFRLWEIVAETAERGAA